MKVYIYLFLGVLMLSGAVCVQAVDSEPTEDEQIASLFSSYPPPNCVKGTAKSEIFVSVSYSSEDAGEGQSGIDYNIIGNLKSLVNSKSFLKVGGPIYRLATGTKLQASGETWIDENKTAHFFDAFSGYLGPDKSNFHGEAYKFHISPKEGNNLIWVMRWKLDSSVVDIEGNSYPDLMSQGDLVSALFTGNFVQDSRYIFRGQDYSLDQSSQAPNETFNTFIQPLPSLTMPSGLSQASLTGDTFLFDNSLAQAPTFASPNSRSRYVLEELKYTCSQRELMFQTPPQIHSAKYNPNGEISISYEMSPYSKSQQEGIPATLTAYYFVNGGSKIFASSTQVYSKKGFVNIPAVYGDINPSTDTVTFGVELFDGTFRELGMAEGKVVTPPVPVISIDKVTGGAGASQTVSFSAADSENFVGGISHYDWVINGATPSSISSGGKIANFIIPATTNKISVTLKVTDIKGTISKTTTNNYQLPKPNFYLSKAPQKVASSSPWFTEFNTAGSGDEDGSILNFTFSGAWGSIGPKLGGVYQMVTTTKPTGIRNVTLTVRDNHGFSRSVSKPIDLGGSASTGSSSTGSSSTGSSSTPTSGSSSSTASGGSSAACHQACAYNTNPTAKYYCMQNHVACK